MSAKIFVIIPVVLLYLATLFPSWIVSVIAPDFDASHGRVLGRLETREYLQISHFGFAGDYEEVVDELFEPSVMFHEYSLRGTALRFLLTPASPLEMGSLLETQTWKKWFTISGTWIGVAKLVFIATFYLMLPSFLVNSSGGGKDDSLDGPLQIVSTYGLVGGIIMPLLAWIMSSLWALDVAWLSMLLYVVAFLLGMIISVVELVAISLFGTLVRLLCIPLLLLHSGLFILIHMFV